MGIATSFTSDRMLDIEQNSVVAGLVDINGDLILEKRSGAQINAGNVIGPVGPPPDFDVEGVAPTSVSWNDIKSSGLYQRLMNTVDNPNGPPTSSNQYYYVLVFTYYGMNLTQMAYPYIATYYAPVYIRHFYANAWGDWMPIGLTLDMVNSFDSLLTFKSETEASNLVGGKGLIPASMIAGGGGTISVDAHGLITFNNCSIIAIDGIFNGLGADVYKIYSRIQSHHSGASSIWTRMRKAGVGYTGSTYNYVGNYTLYATGPTRYATFATQQYGYWQPGLGTAQVSTAAEMTLFDPFSSSMSTRYFMNTYSFASDRPLTYEGGDVGGGSFDGFEVRGNSGNISGWFKIVKAA